MLKRKLGLLGSVAVSLLAVAVASVSTYAWFQMKTSEEPSTSAISNGMRTDAFVYNKNPGHSNDDMSTLSASGDAGGTLSYDHSKGGTPTDWYIVGDCVNASKVSDYYNYTSKKSTGTLAGGNWDLGKSLQMFKNPGATSDKAVYFNMHFTVGTTFKIASSSGTWLGYSTETFDFGADLAGHFAAGHQGGSDDNIYCWSECTADVYVNGGNKVAIVSRDEFQDERDVDSHVGFYIVGNNTSQDGSSKAATGAFKGGDFDLDHCYEVNFDSHTNGDANCVGAYYGLHLYVNDYFKLWDGRTRDAGSGWYGYNTESNRGLLADTTYFDDKNDAGVGADIICKKEGYYDIFVYTTVVGGAGGGQYVKITHHIQDSPEAGTVRGIRPTTRAASTTVGHIIYFKPSSNWNGNGTEFRFAIYYWKNGSDNGWLSMIATDVNGYYAAIIPAGYTSYKFAQMYSGNSDNNWNTGYGNPHTGKSSGDLSIANDNNSILVDMGTSNWDSTWTTSNGSGVSLEELSYYLVGNSTSSLSGSGWAVESSTSYSYSGTNHMVASSISLPQNSEYKVYVCKGTTPIDHLGYSNISSDSMSAHSDYYENVSNASGNIKIDRAGTWDIGVNSTNEVYMNLSHYNTFTLTKTPKTFRNGVLKTTGSNSTQTLNYNESTTVTALTKPTGTTFAGWWEDATCTSTKLSDSTSFSYTITSNKTIYARYNLNSYTWTLHYKYFPASGNATSGSDKTQTVYYDDSIKPSDLDLTDRGKTGYYFVGWFTNVECTTPYSESTVTGARNDLYAKYAQATVQIYGIHNGAAWGSIGSAKGVSSTVSWTGVSLTAADEIKIRSFNENDATDNGYYPNGTEGWSEKYGSTTVNYSGSGSYSGIYAVMSKASGHIGNLVIRYTGTYTITASVNTTTFAVTNVTIQPTAINANNFVLTKSGAAAPSTEPGDDNASGQHTFVWDDSSFAIGETFCIETTHTSSYANIKGSWGAGFIKSEDAEYVYSTDTNCTQDTTKKQLASVFNISSCSITFTLELGSNNIDISSAVKGDYEPNNTTGSPVGIYLSYNTGSSMSDAPQTLAYQNDASNLKIRMNYDGGNFPGANSTTVLHTRDVDSNDYKNPNITYDIKATLASFTARTTYYCNIFHNLDKRPYMVNKIWYDQGYTGNYNHTGGGFVLPAGTYNIYLVGVNGCGPWHNAVYSTQGSAWDVNGGDGYGDADYRVYIERTNPSSLDEEHEVPVYLVGRGMPGSDLENGDYSNSKIEAYPYNSTAAYRYVPFYAVANQVNTFPCYANKNEDAGVNLKVGDRFVFSDGGACRATITYGTNVDSDDIAVVNDEIVVKHSGKYVINSTGTAFGTATFTFSSASTISGVASEGNDATIGANDLIGGYSPVSYSKDHGVRVLNASGSTLNFGGSFDSSLLDSGEGYVSFMIELRHINKNAAGTISATIAGLPSGAQYRFVQVDSTGANYTAMDDAGLTFSSWKSNATTNIFTDAAIGVNTTANTAYDTCFAKATLIEVKVPISTFFANTERISYDISFSITVTYKETISA